MIRTMGTGIVCLLLSGLAAASAPAKLPVYGYLATAQGEPVDGAINVTFRLYSGATATTALYTETQAVQANQGYISIMLGETESLDLALLRDSSVLYLGVTIEGEAEMTPRLEIATAPYAAFAQYAYEAESLQGLSATDFASASHRQSWSTLDDVPATFPPATHTHAWGDISSKPATFPPATHSHAFSSLTSVPAGLADGDDDTVPAMSCAAGSVLTWNGSAYDCVIDQNSDVLAALSCANGQVAKMSSSGWICGDDSNTTYQAGSGISVVGSSISIAPGGIANSHVASGAAIDPAKISGTAWTASNDGVGSGLNADLLDGLSSSSFQTALKTTVVVSPVGTATQNGTALVNALAGIADASASKPYLLKIEPGIYDLGSSYLSAKPYVDIKGSGQNVTKIIAAVSGGSATLTINGTSDTGFADPIEVSDLTIEDTGTGGTDKATGVSITDAAVTLKNVKVIVTQNSTAARCYGVSAGAPSYVSRNFRIDACEIECRGTSLEAYTIFTTSHGEIRNSTILATSTTSDANYALTANANGNVYINNSTLSYTGTNTSPLHAGIRTAFNGTLEMVNSAVQGANGPAVAQITSSPMKIAHSKIIGTISSGGALTCFGNYDNSYAAISCP